MSEQAKTVDVWDDYDRYGAGDYTAAVSESADRTIEVDLYGPGGFLHQIDQEHLAANRADAERVGNSTLAALLARIEHDYLTGGKSPIFAAL
jgi:hypothetical protein